MVVGGVAGAQEGSSAHPAHVFDRLKTEHVGVELHARLQVVDEQHSVVELEDPHVELLSTNSEGW